MNKKKVHDRGSYLFVYIYLFLAVIIFSHIVVLLANINFFHTDIHNAREMLGVLFESQATIIALVITLTLVAVQLTASEYSPRVIGIFRKDPYMWTLFVLYGISMLYDLILLKLVEEGEKEVVNQSVIWSYGPVSISFEWLVSSALLFGTFTFFALIPFILHTIDLLKPKNIINQLANEITKDKFLNSKEDPILPIVDIIRRSIMIKYDSETVKVGLKEVTEQVISIIDQGVGSKISDKFCKHLQGLGKLATSDTDEESTKRVIENLKIFGESTAPKKLEQAARKAAEAIKVVGEATARKGKELEEATWAAILSLEAVGRTTANEKLPDATWEVASSIGDIEKASVENGKKSNVVIAQAALSLAIVGVLAEKDGLENAANKAASYLAELSKEEIVKTSISKNESYLKKLNHTSFLKFKERYDKECKKR